MELTLNSELTTLDINELGLINGGYNWFEIGLGVLTTVGAVAGLVAAPEITIPVVLTYYGGLGAAGDFFYNGLK
jgi:hypothetical protein